MMTVFTAPPRAFQDRKTGAWDEAALRALGLEGAATSAARGWPGFPAARGTDGLPPLLGDTRLPGPSWRPFDYGQGGSSALGGEVVRGRGAQVA